MARVVCLRPRAVASGAGACCCWMVSRCSYTHSRTRSNTNTASPPTKNSAPENTRLRFDFKYDGGGIGKGGTGTLLVDGQQVAQGRIERTVRVRFSLDETFDVGEDTGTAVIEEYAAQLPYKFTGTLAKLTIDLASQTLSAKDQKDIEEGAKAMKAAE